MKRKLIVICGFLMCNLFLFAQVDKMKDLLNDEMDTDNFTLRFFNALDANPIKGGIVEIEGVGVYTTDFEGKVKFPRLEEDQNLHVIFKAEGFITTDISVEVVAGTIFQNRISISPVMAMEYVRIILDWGRNPKDLDAHFVKEDGYHISYRNMKLSDDDVAKLDRDDTDSFGPETITIKEIDTDKYYEFWVHDYTNRLNNNSRKLSGSGASVKVYGNGELLEYVTIPPGDRGNKWNVFVIKDGQIQLINNISSEE